MPNPRLLACCSDIIICLPTIASLPSLVRRASENQPSGLSIALRCGGNILEDFVELTFTLLREIMDRGLLLPETLEQHTLERLGKLSQGELIREDVLEIFKLLEHLHKEPSK